MSVGVKVESTLNCGRHSYQWSIELTATAQGNKTKEFPLNLIGVS
jgi:hypothetical protein